MSQKTPTKPTYDELLQAIIEAHTEIGELLIGYEIEDDLDHSPRKLHNKLWDLIQRNEKIKGEK